LLVLCLNKGRCTFATSDFPAENPRTQTRNFPYTKPLYTINNFMTIKYTLKTWLFTGIVTPHLLYLILGLFVKKVNLIEIFDSYIFILIVILNGLIFSIPAMIIFWILARNLEGKFTTNRLKIILSIYSFISVWVTFYLIGFEYEKVYWVITYSLIIVSGVWIFNFKKKAEENKNSVQQRL